MNKAKVVITAGAVFLSAAFAVTFLHSKEKTSEPKSSEVYTWDCEYPEVKPEAITITCADGGISVNRIEWSRWNQSGAEGIGFYSVNDCDPNCAEGTILEIPVRAFLRDLITYKNKQYLRRLEIKSVSGENLPQSGMNFLISDLSDFRTN